ncbi:MAG: amidohydrolase family protein [Candidatus Sericytochromatia bacterium]|nr:amidohydrolase family protein [Candidatus Sericytochromatia bacterium]
MYDLVIRNGLLVDGTGAPGYLADVAVSGDRIVAVGEVGAGRREIDAAGLLITPGFVDVHTHYDAQVTWDPHMTPSSWHGVTTVVMGNCGVGFAPAAPDRHEWLIGLMEGVEDIPGAALTEGISWSWETFPQYLDAIEATPHAIDFGAQISHGALRAYVMGERGANNEDATAADITAMRDTVAEALRAGALGFSTSRTLLHKSISGVPVPGTFASQDELKGIGAALKAVGHGVFQMAAGEHANMAEEFAWMKDLADEIGQLVTFSLSQSDQAPQVWRQVAKLLEGAAVDGTPLMAQVAGRAIGVMMGWHTTAHPFVGYPSFQAVIGLPKAERIARLQDPAFRAQLLSESSTDLGDFGNFVTRSFHKMYVMPTGCEYEPTASEALSAVAARDGRRPEEIAYEAMLAANGEGMLYFPLFNYSDGNLELLHTLHQLPNTLMGLSDAGAHCGAICDGGMPTFMLTHWTRDRSRGARLPLEYMIKRQTSDTAKAFGMHDRGVVAPGMKADLNLIDYAKLTLMQPELAYDLPAGGRRLIQKAAGYVATIVSGVVIAENGEPTGAFPGKLVRGPQAAPPVSATSEPQPAAM